MNTSDTTQHTVITRVAPRHWHALEDDQVIGRGHASRRPDGRMFLSIDAWFGSVFGRLAEAMLADLPRPLSTVVDEADLDLTANWRRAGFTTRRREWEYLVPTDPQVTGLGSARPPAGVTIVPAGAAHEDPLRRLDGVIRDEIAATVGWAEMPAEVLPGPRDAGTHDWSRYAVAAEAGHYVALLRLAALPRQPRIGLIAVRADRRRRGIARALLAQVLGSLHQPATGRRFEAATAEVNESNEAAMALFEGIGARRVASNLELVLR